MMKSLLNLKRCLTLAVALVFAGSALAQSITVTGTVTDTSGEPLLGVTVMVDGTTTGTATGVDGTYTIKAPNAQSVLVFSFMGYAPQNVTVGNQTKIDVALAEDAESIEDVIVIGYGTIKKSDLTGAVSHVGQQDIQERPVTDALQALQGKVAGMDIVTNGRVGELGQVRIRGSRSKNASNDPLYVVDGMPLSAGSMTELNPNDIESIDVLKDASATAIYGSRGANGVILVTTKKGERGRVSVNYDGSLQVSWAKSIADWATTSESMIKSHYTSYSAAQFIGKGAAFEKYTLGAYTNSQYQSDSAIQGYGALDPYKDYQSYYPSAYSYMWPVLASAYQYRALTDAEGKTYIDPSNPVLVPGTDYLGNTIEGGIPVFTPENMYDHDWTKDVIRTGIAQNHQISISGGTDKSRIYASAAFLGEDPVQMDQSYRRFTFNMNGEVKANWFTMGMSNNVSYTLRNYGFVDHNNFAMNYSNSLDAYGNALEQSRSVPAYYLDYIVENGIVVGAKETDRILDLEGKNGDTTVGLYNPVVLMNEATNEYRVWTAMNSTYVELQLAPWLRWRTNMGGQYRINQFGSYYNANFRASRADVAFLQPQTGYYQNQTSMSWTLENLLYIDKKFGQHAISATLLQSAEESESNKAYMRAYNLPFDASLWYNLGSTSDGMTQDFGTSYTKTRLASYMGRLNYTFGDRYLLTLTGRYDGASVLANGHKWDFFPSASIAWRIDQENFMKNQNLFSQLKLRLGYGVTGNSSVSAYSTTGSLSSFSQIFGDSTYSAVKSMVMPNELLSWEKTGQWNVGIDFGFLNNRISGTLEAYQSDTRDLLMSKSLSTTTGYNSVQANIGGTRNQGVELTLTSRNIEKRNFSWVTTLSIGTNRDEITETIYGKDVDDPSNNMYIGQSMATIRAAEFDRMLGTSDEDLRTIGIYWANNIFLMPGRGLYKDQPMILRSEATADQIAEFGTVTKNISWIDNAGATHEETIEYLNNGFGLYNTSTTDAKTDLVFRGTSRPRWQGGLTNTLTYKQWALNFYIYARFGNMVSGTGNLGSMECNYDDYWRFDNQDAKYSIIYSSSNGQSYSDYNNLRWYYGAQLVSVRNIALSYTFPQNFLKKVKLSSGQVYTQILNPFLFSNQKKFGINPDVQNKSALNGSNNTVMYQSFVLGLRLGF